MSYIPPARTGTRDDKKVLLLSFQNIDKNTEPVADLRLNHRNVPSSRYFVDITETQIKPSRCSIKASNQNEVDAAKHFEYTFR